MEFGKGLGPILLDDVRCFGNESSLFDCSHRGIGTHNCDHTEDAGVICKEFQNLTLQGGNELSGRVEVFVSGPNQWGTVCDDNWGDAEASVVCRQLGLSGGKAIQNGKFGIGLGPIWLDNVSCFGNESSLFDCSHSGIGIHNCDHTEDAGVICKGYIGSAVFATIGQEIASLKWHLTNYYPTITVYYRGSSTIRLFTIVRRTFTVNYNTDYKNKLYYTGHFSNTTMSFALENVTKADAGYYLSTQSDSVTKMGGLVLVVLDKPRKPVITFGRAIVGKPLILICKSQHTSEPYYYVPELQYRWFINGSIHVYDTMHQGRFQSHGNTLTITDVQKGDKGRRFKCQSSDHGQLSEMSNLYSIDPLSQPEITQIMYKINNNDPSNYDRSIEVSESDDVIIICNVDGDPLPKISWYFKNTTLVRHQSVNSLVHEFQSIQGTSSGVYTCTADNGIKLAATRSIKLRVKSYSVPDSQSDGVPDSQSDGAGGIIAGVVGAVILVALIVVGTIVFFIRRYKNRSKAKTKKGPDNTEVKYAVVNKSDRNDKKGPDNTEVMHAVVNKAERNDNNSEDEDAIICIKGARVASPNFCSKSAQVPATIKQKPGSKELHLH